MKSAFSTLQRGDGSRGWERKGCDWAWSKTGRGGLPKWKPEKSWYTGGVWGVGLLVRSHKIPSMTGQPRGRVGDC